MAGILVGAAALTGVFRCSLARDTSGPRVAICFFGLTRFLSYTIQSIRSAIYDPLITEDIPYDVFVHTYNATEAAHLWRGYAEAALADPGLDARAEQNRCYDDGGSVTLA
ncbi:g5367 [Coccomyxa elongata]